VITRAVARLFRVGVGGRVTYEFYRLDPATYAPSPVGHRSYTVAAIVDLPPVLADQSDQVQTGILPPAATAQVLASYNFAWVGLRLDHGTAGIPALQRELAGLAARVETQVQAVIGQKLPGLAFNIRNAALVRGEVQQSIRPQAVALTVFGGFAAQRARLVRVITAANPDGTTGGTYQLTQYRAAAVEDASKMGSQPLALALGLAAAAVLSLALTVLASVRRRRRELAPLKTLGLTRRQLRAIVAWQTTFTLLIAVALGVPLGVAAGRLAWQAFAGSIGAVPVTAVPGLLLAAGAVILVVAGNVLTAAPGAVAASTDPAAALRAE
jgi:hypothetical protein